MIDKHDIEDRNLHDDAPENALSPEPENALSPEPEKRSQAWLYCGVAGLLVTILAWGFLMFIPDISLWLSVGGVVLSAAGIRVSRCCWRDIAISSLIASGVLLLVHIIFNWALDYAISTL